MANAKFSAEYRLDRYVTLLHASMINSYSNGNFSTVGCASISTFEKSISRRHFRDIHQHNADSLNGR
jgi:hypothetical protein